MVILCIIFPIYLLCHVHMGCHADNAPVNGTQEPCRKIDGAEVLSLPGHSLEIPYSEAMGIQMYLKSQNLREGARITCIVTDTDSNKVLNSTEFPRIEDPFNSPMKLAHQIHNVSEDTPLHYRIQCGNDPNSTMETEQQEEEEDRCMFYNINITIINDSAEDCTGPAIKTLPNQYIRQGYSMTLNCDAPESIKKLPNVTYHWFQEKNGECVTDFNDDVYVDERSNDLNIRMVDFHDAGVYTCMAYHKNQKIVMVRIITCVKYSHVSNKDMVLTCNTAKVPINGNGTITCEVSVSKSKSKAGHYFWYKIGSNEEEKLCDNSYPGDGSKVSCSEESSIDHDECYHTEPSGDPPLDIRTITLNINNMKEEDFGEYRLQYQVNGIFNGRLESNVSIEMDLKARVTIHIAGIAVGVLAIILIIVSIALCFTIKMDILWFYKKHFGPCEQGICPYMAYFVYHYQEGQQNGESNKKTKALVEHMHEFMDKFGGTVFDEQRNIPLEQCDANNILAVLNECHRIVLFLSVDFVTDHWSRFATYAAIEAMIREGKKIILITMPETKSSMKDIEDDARRVLEMAMERNTTIHWNGKVPFSGAFCRRLEYALPKRRQTKPDFNRYLSDSSQAHLTQYTGSPSKSLMELKKTDYENVYENPSAV